MCCLWTINCRAKSVQPRLDSELLADGRNGDGQALSELFERHYTSSLRVARRILRSDEEAYDAVQSAYLAAFEHLHGFRGDAQFNTWMTRIVMNQCFIYLRRPERRRVYSNLEEEYGRDGVWLLRTGHQHPRISHGDANSTARFPLPLVSFRSACRMYTPFVAPRVCPSERPLTRWVSPCLPRKRVCFVPSIECNPS